MRRLLRLLVQVYQVTLSPYVGGNCRFEPSCSHYAIEALESQPLWKALGLIFYRLARCHPFGGSGYDPVPVSHLSGGARGQ